MATQNADQRRLHLIQQLLTLPAAQLGEVENVFARLHTGVAPARVPSSPSETPVLMTPSKRDWPHTPTHRLSEQGTYIVTSGTYEKRHFFQGTERLDYLEANLLSLAKQYGWQLEAWAVFSNHYHFVGHSSPDPHSLSALTKELHGKTSRHVNQLDQLTDRPVWFNFWDTRLTFEKSYFARLCYVHRNAVKHGLVSLASQYRWCSAAWLERTTSPAQVETLYRFKIDKIAIHDDFDPV